MKILLTGANGLLGQKLVELLESNGTGFLATSQGASRIQIPGIRYLSLDITDKNRLLEVVEEYRPTVIINTAAMTQVDQCETERDACWKLNVQAVTDLITAAAKVNAHLIHLSTDFIFDGLNGPYREEDQPNPVNFYGRSKWEAEKLLYESKIKWSIARTILVYGATPGVSRSNIMLWVKQNLDSGKPIRVVDDQFRTPTLVEDLAMGCFLMAQQSAAGIYHISGEELLTPFDIATITAEHFSLNKSLITRTDSTLFTQPARRPPKTGFIVEKAKKELGYQPHSFREGLDITASNLGLV
ncbi:MAG: NAD(P)-dependent oxidoreductase [Cyclobacteriaceae bacterium]|nr:MAG: NAD(P)-dependent oxidoreductase [Cyclobacteriaceae bacterium]